MDETTNRKMILKRLIRQFKQMIKIEGLGNFLFAELIKKAESNVYYILNGKSEFAECAADKAKLVLKR